MSNAQGEQRPARRAARHAPATDEERDERQERRGVRGPSSALSSFLRERGIRVPTNPYSRISNPTTAEETPEIQGTQQASTEMAEDAASISAHRTTESLRLDPELQTQASLQRQFPKKREPDEDLKKPRKKRQISTLINFCKTCNRRFLTQNTQQCIACTSILPNKKSLQKQQDQVLRITGILDSKIMSLRDMCLKVLSDNVDLIDSLGFIEPESKTRFARVISKNRRLDANTLELFLGEKEDELRLFDCTLLDQSGLAMIPLQCPSLRILDLGLCGRLNDYVLGLIGDKLLNLEVLCFKGKNIVKTRCVSLFGTRFLWVV
jgi:DNA repair protein RAD7